MIRREELPSLPSRTHWLAGILTLVCIIVYGASLGNGFAILDDGLLIYENNILRDISFANFKIIFTNYDPELYIPLTLISYQIDYLIGGYSPFIYHLTNLLLHTLNALLVTLFLYLLTKRQWVAFFCGILFAVHPLHTETVAWAAARKDLLSAFFFLSALVSYMYYRGAEGIRTRKIYGASIGLFLLGLLSKVTVITLPIILLLIDFLQKRPLKESIKDKLPYFALSILFGIIALGGKQDIISVLSLIEKNLLAFKSISFYIQKIFLPTNLSVFYPQLTDISLTRPEFFIPAVISLLLLFCAWFLRKRNGIVSFGILFYLITLAPSFLSPSKGGNNVYFASDRYAYIPSIGIILIIGILLYHFCAKPESLAVQKKRISSVLTALIVVAVIFSGLTIKQSLLWGNNIKLFTQSTRLYPDFYLGHINLAVSYREKRKLQEAEQELRKALSHRKLANTRGVLAQVIAEQGDFTDAIKEFHHAIEMDPEEAELYHGLGQVYALQGDFDAALAEYEKALALTRDEDTEYEQLSRRIASRRDMFYYRIGLLYGERKMHEEAIEYYQKAIAEDPYFADAEYNLAVGLGSIGKVEEAITHYEKAVAFDPKHGKARVNLGILYYRSGKEREAKALFEEVLKIDPQNEVALKALQRM